MPCENRLGRHAVFASVEPLASAAVTNSVVADIHHQADVGLIVGGFGAVPEAKLLSIPEYGAMRVIAGHRRSSRVMTPRGRATSSPSAKVTPRATRAARRRSSHWSTLREEP